MLISEKNNGKKLHMKTSKSLEKMVKWFCRKLTRNEFASAVIIIHEVLSGTRQFDFKPETEPQSANYRRFDLNELRALNAPPEPSRPTQDWRQLKAEYFHLHGKELKPVSRRPGAMAPPEYCTCSVCGAPHEYLYLNDGKKGNQVRCKICAALSPTEQVRRESKATYRCPYCGCALFLWKHNDVETIYKCPNRNCKHYLDRLAELTKMESAERESNIYTPNYKLHYQYREYHFSAADLNCARPGCDTRVDLRLIHNSYHTVGLVLSLFVNLSMSSRGTRDALKGLFDIDISHQTVINYVEAAAAQIAPWLDRNLPKPSATSAGDETYVIVDGENHFTWFVIDSATRAICGYNVSGERDTKSALATLYDAFGPPDAHSGAPYVFVRDGLPSYDAAVAAYNQSLDPKHPALVAKSVIGLENQDATSTEYRSFKQLIERLNRTYKFHTRPRAGFKRLEGCVCLTTLFVAYYNYMRKHMAREKRPPLHLDALNGISSYPKQWERLIQLAAA
jgi:transposase-like protein/Zn-finger nucleic acid-binding protein